MLSLLGCAQLCEDLSAISALARVPNTAQLLLRCSLVGLPCLCAGLLQGYGCMQGSAACWRASWAPGAGAKQVQTAAGLIQEGFGLQRVL